MNHFLLGILRIIFLEAGGALLIVSRLRARTRHLSFAFVVLAALALVGWTRFGDFHGGGSYVHRWEQVHFYFGSKYLREVRYTDLYKAIFLADRELDGLRLAAPVTRDLTTFEEVPVTAALVDAPRVRAHFTDARWDAFKADWSAARKRGAPWSLVLKDHGNTGSPAWALFAAPIASVVPFTAAGEELLALFDVLLLAVMFAVIFRTFGARAGAVAGWIFACIPFTFDMLFGSFLRWDWLFALTLSLCAWKRGRPLTAGGFFAYAVTSKLFPVFFGLALAIKAAQELARTRRLPVRFVRFAVGAALAACTLFAASSAAFDGPSIWRDYAARIEVAEHEKYYSNQYSFRTVYLQIRYSRPAAFLAAPFTPREINQARPDVPPSSGPDTVLVATQLALTALLVWIVLQHDEVSAFATGPFFVYVWLTVNAYYWNMLALPALAWAHEKRALAPLLGLHALLMAYYFYQHLDRAYAEGYFVGSLLLALIAVMAWSRGPSRPIGAKV